MITVNIEQTSQILLTQKTRHFVGSEKKMISCQNQTLRKSIHSSLSEEILTFYL